MGEKKIESLWDLEDAIAFMKVSRSTVYELMAKKKIRYHKIGRKTRFVPDELKADVKKL